MLVPEFAQERGEFFVAGGGAELYVLRVGVLNQGDGEGGFVQECYQLFPIDFSFSDRTAVPTIPVAEVGVADVLAEEFESF